MAHVFFVGFCTCFVDGENVYKSASKTEFCGKRSARGPRVITQWTQLWVSSQIMMKHERWYNFWRKCALRSWHGAPRSDRESSEYAFMTSAWTNSCGNRQDFFSQLMLCLSFCRKSKKSCKMFTWFSRKKCAKQRERFRPPWWWMDLYPHGDELHLGFRLRGHVSISNAW